MIIKDCPGSKATPLQNGVLPAYIVNAILKLQSIRPGDLSYYAVVDRNVISRASRPREDIKKIAE